MAITQPSPSSPLLLGVGGGMPSPAAGSAGGQALGAPLQGGGFHFHFTGSLQAYQEARAGAEAGRVLPPNGESLPGHSAVRPDSEPDAAVAEPSQLPVSDDGVDADARLLHGENGSSPVVVPSADAIDGDSSQQSDTAMISASQQAGTVESTGSAVDNNTDLQRSRAEQVEGERGNPSLRPSDSAQQAAAQASREGVAVEHSAVQQAQQQSPLNQQAQPPEQIPQGQIQQPGQAPRTQQEQKEQQTQQAQLSLLSLPQLFAGRHLSTRRVMSRRGAQLPVQPLPMSTTLMQLPGRYGACQEAVQQRHPECRGGQLSPCRCSPGVIMSLQRMR